MDNVGMGAFNGSRMKDLRVAMICAAPLTFNAPMRKHILKIGSHYQMTLVCGGDRSQLRPDILSATLFHGIPIKREISLIKDLHALYGLYNLFRDKHFDLIHSITPKAGLLAMIAGRLSGVQVRVHVFTGQVWATKKGLTRFLLKSLDRLTAALATHVLTDSFPQMTLLVSEGVVDEQKIQVLENGSICGVDPERFRPDSMARKEIRSKLAIPEEAVVAIFVGRLTRDKGISDLVEAFNLAAELAPNLHLLIVGPDEQNLTNELKKVAANVLDRLHFLGHSNEPEKMVAAADFFCLPSYREGFASVVLEAAATGLPTIASNIYGLTDAVKDGKTGFLHETKSVDQISALLVKYALDRNLRLKMGENARRRVIKFFSSDRLVDAQMLFYKTVLNSSKGH
jgi:glycosyltransferase involved in cell wall biosynthesis